MDLPAAWWDGQLVGFDLETTGVEVETDRIVTANVTWHHPQRNPSIRNFLLNPGIDIPVAASNVHGISTEYAREHGMDARQGVLALLELLNKCAALPFVAFNGVYDFTLLDREARRYGLQPFAPQVMIDPLVLDKALVKYRSGPGARKLTTLAPHYGVTLDNAHTADADAMATIELARAMGRTGKLTTNLEELHAQQVAWKAQQDADFRNWKASRGEIIEGCDGHWPLIPFQERVAAA